MNFFARRNFFTETFAHRRAAKFAWLLDFRTKWLFYSQKKTAKLNEALPVKFVLAAPAY